MSEEQQYTEEEFNKALGDVLTSIADRADAERKKEKPYQDLFRASEQGLQGLLSEANHKMTSVVLDLTTVIKEKFGLKHVSRELYDLLKALPIGMSKVREDIDKKDGMSCCADKARRIYYHVVLDAINRCKAEQK